MSEKSLAEKAIPYLLSALIALGGAAWVDMRSQVNKGNDKAEEISRAVNSLSSSIAVQQNEIANQGQRIGGLERRVERLEGIAPPKNPIADVRSGFIPVGVP